VRPGAGEQSFEECAVSAIGRTTTKVATRFSQLGVMVPELGIRRRPLSSGLNARDQIACVTQASMKCRKDQHDDAILRHSLRKVNGDTRGDDQSACSQSGRGSCSRQESVVRMKCAASALVSTRRRLATSWSGSRVATRYDKFAANYLTFITLASIRI
jgi:hypothetical protein